MKSFRLPPVEFCESQTASEQALKLECDGAYCAGGAYLDRPRPPETDGGHGTGAGQARKT